MDDFAEKAEYFLHQWILSCFTLPRRSGMSGHVKAGSEIAVVGPTRAGKTTLVNLLMRFYELQGGKITIDGVNINQMN